MRPNIDVPWSTHGRVKEYANDNDLSLDAAYRELIEQGLSSDPDTIERVVTDVLLETSEIQDLLELRQHLREIGELEGSA